MKKVSLNDLITALERLAPLAWQESFDNSGLLIGSSCEEINKALVCLDISEEVIDEAIEKKANLIISHHPIIFQGLKSIHPNTVLGRKLEKCLCHHIACYCAHTNLDNSPEGINVRLANKLGLQKLRTLGQTGLGVGSGVIGDLPKALDPKDFLSLLHKKIGKIHIRHSVYCGKKIKSVSLCGGSGNFLIPLALNEGADVFISGELKYHDFCDANSSLWLVDIGHFESEVHAREIIFAYITKIFPNFAVEISEKEKNPIQYEDYKE